MKKFIAMLAIALLSINVMAKEVARNPKTDLVLDEVEGIYTLMGKGGITFLGDAKSARNLMFEMAECFAQNKLAEVISIGDQKFNVKIDDDGVYITKIGLGACKIRPSDTALFLTVLETVIVADKGKKIWKVIME